jgi:heat shock protein 1/8
MNIHA